MSKMKLASAAVVALLALAGGQGIANAQESAAVPMRAAASYERCNTGVVKGLVGGAKAIVPGYKGHWSCWLDTDQSRMSYAVSLLQQGLRNGERMNVGIDGYYGPATKNAVRAVQYRRNIAADGIYGPQTGWSMLWRSVDQKTIAKWG